MDERGVQQTIANWLETQGEATIHWAESPPKGYQRFTFSNVKDRPDLLAISKCNIVIEIKDGNDSSSIYDAMSQVHEYWRQYEFGKAVVEAGGNEIDVDAFLLATQYSPEGHLFKSEREQGYRRTYTSQEAGWNKGERPQYEYARTESVPRIQWRYAWNEAEYRKDRSRTEIKAGIGVLLSDEIETDPGQASFSEYSKEVSLSSVPMALFYNGEVGSIWIEIVG